MKRVGRISACVCALAMIAAAGCSGDKMTFKNGRFVKADSPGGVKQALKYHVTVPADLPGGGTFRDTAGLPDQLSDDDVKNGYRSSHVRGWTLCMKDISEGTAPDNIYNPPFALQGYDHETRGHADGYKDCAATVRAAIAQYGRKPVLTEVKATVDKGKDF
ncbi:MAG: hypothetical protein LLG01_16980 [Planctomycetaceae bacterium]|nr:hypothetical protein [Planctomycetaceae bacterium]